jgi:hypothetical protein
MYRRKIGKKIFRRTRRTRKNKFYDIKVKKKPSMLTRKRVRSGGVGETVLIKGIRETNPNITLDKNLCDDFANRANYDTEEATRNGDNYEFSESAIRDSNDCVEFLNGDNIQKVIEENIRNTKELRNIEYVASALAQKNLEYDITDIIEKQNAISEEEFAKIQKIKDITIMKNLIGNGFTNVPIEKLNILIPFYLILEIHSSKVYKIIFAILIELIKFKDNYVVFIERLSRELSEKSYYRNVITLLYSLIPLPDKPDSGIPSFQKLYNSIMTDDDSQLKYIKVGDKIQCKFPSFINVNKVLQILYKYYDIIMLICAQYYVLLNVYSEQLTSIGEHDRFFLLGDKFNLIPIDNEFKVSNDAFLSVLLTNFTIDKELRHTKIPVNIETVVKALRTLLIKEVSFLRSNETLTSESENLEKVFSLYQPHGGQLNILKSEDSIENSVFTYFNHITWVKTFLLTYRNIFCFSGAFGLSTKTKVRKSIETKIIINNLTAIEQMIESGEIFKNPQLENVDLKLPTLNGKTLSITEFILAILKENTQDDKRCKDTYAFIEFTKYADDPQSNSYYLGIFCNMVIYACYMSTSKIEWGKKREIEWGKEGTDLMIIYMNLFIIEYVKHLLENLSTIITPFLNFLLDTYQQPSKTYIFYGFGILYSIEACKNAKIILETINTFLKNTYKKNYNYVDALIRGVTSTTITPLEALLNVIIKPFNDRNAKLLKETHLNTALCVGINECNIFKETLNPSNDSTSNSAAAALQQILSMNEINLHRKIMKVCTEMLDIAIDSMALSKSKKEEISLDIGNVLKFLPTQQQNSTVEMTDGLRKQCELVVANTINMARKHKPGSPPILLTDEEIHDIDVCAIPENVFDHQKKNLKEFNKRIARSYYGIKEIMDVCDERSYDKIRNLSNVQRLNKLIEKYDNVKGREIVRDHCNDDHKGILGFHNQTRELIKAGLSGDKIKEKCLQNLKMFDTYDSAYEDGWLQDTKEGEIESKIIDLAELQKREQFLTERLARSKRIISDAKEVRSQGLVKVFEARQKNIEDKIKKIQTQIRNKKQPQKSLSWWRIGSKSREPQIVVTGGSKHRSKTIKIRRRQQKQHKTKKYGLKYRVPRPNRKTRKHLDRRGRGRDRGRGRHHHRTR